MWTPQAGLTWMYKIILSGSSSNCSRSFSVHTTKLAKSAGRGGGKKEEKGHTGCLESQPSLPGNPLIKKMRMYQVSRFKMDLIIFSPLSVSYSSAGS